MSWHRRMLLAAAAIVALVGAVGVVSVHTEARLHQRLASRHPGFAASAETDGSSATSRAEEPAPAVEASHFVLGTSITAAALALLVAFLLWRSIATPLGALRQAAVRLGAGRLDTRVTLPERDELGMLGSTLNGMAERLAVSMQCITLQRRVQEALQRSLEQKELLLREVHHRMKNNFQVVSSLLDLQSRSIGDPLLTEELEVSQNRIRCMALVHEYLYGGKQFEHVGAREYLKQLASHLVDSFGRPRSICLHLDLEDLQLDVDRAMTVGLLANELLSNALKHAFPANRAGEVRLQLASQGDVCVLTVADDGVGMPPEAPREKTGRLGMSLVTTFARQLRGSVSVESTEGTQVHVTFPRVHRLQEVAAS